MIAISIGIIVIAATIYIHAILASGRFHRLPGSPRCGWRPLAKALGSSLFLGFRVSGGDCF